MPTYEYACTACGHRLDAVQKFSDEPLTLCPECGGDLRKVYGAVGIVLKGSGFYKTDSRNGAIKAGAGAKESSGTDSSGGDSKPADTKTESAPAATDTKKKETKTPAPAAS